MATREAYDALMKFYPLTLDDLDGEQWRDIDGYEGFYQVSNFGRVRRLNKTKPPRIMKLAYGIRGYLLVDLCVGNKTKTFRVHRLVAKTFINNPNNKPQVNHIDGNTLNNHVNNLEWATGVENMRHAVEKGLQKSGADTYNAKFTNEQIAFIRNNPDNLTVSKLAEMFDTRTTTISKVQTGQTYKQVDGIIRKSSRLRQGGGAECST